MKGRAVGRAVRAGRTLVTASLIAEGEERINGRSAEAHFAARRSPHGARDEDAAVQAAFDLSYRLVPPDARRLFRLLALVPGPDFTVGAAAALAGVGERDAVRLLDRLAGDHLILQHSRGRFAFNDLLRQYAYDHAERDDTESAAAASRLFGWYLLGADRAALLSYPDVLCLPTADAATRNVDDRTQAMLNHSLARVHHGQGRHQKAIACLERPLGARRCSGPESVA